jgi:radical SAM superfamily enzyme YgiQ (UPF0313 family)
LGPRSHNLYSLIPPFRKYWLSLQKEKEELVVQNNSSIDLILIPPITNPILIDQRKNFIPVGLLVLVANLSHNGYSASIYRPTIKILENQDINKVCKDILLSNPKSVGFSTWCHSYPLSLLLARRIKKLNPEIPIIFGGPQATSLAVETLERYKFIDYILKGEADYSLIRLLDVILAEKSTFTVSDVEGLTYRDPKDSHRIINNCPGGFISNLDDLPVPQYEKLYNKSALLIETGRGCPYNCTYCSTSKFFKRSYRTKSVARIISEIDYCFIKLKASNFGFSHDMITLDRKFMGSLCKALKQYSHKKKKKFCWTCSARTDCVSPHMLKSMAESGCNGIFFGIETGSEQMQRIIKKNLDLTDAVKKVKYSVSQGINSVVSYIAGFPDESREDLNKTLASILLMAVSGASPQISLVTLLPGTPIYKQYVNDLKYDGRNTGMVDTVVPEPVAEFVQTDRIIFSPYFYLENSAVSRETYLFISSIINQLISFIPTLVSLRNYILKSVQKFDILDYIEKKIPDYINQTSVGEPGFFFIVDSIQIYLNHLKNKNLPVFHWEIFQADFIKATILIKYQNWQACQTTTSENIKKPSEINFHTAIKVVPVWKMFESNFDIYNYINRPSPDINKKSPRRGNYGYVVLPVSDRETQILKIQGKYIPIIRNLKDTTFGEFVRNLKPDFTKLESMQLLRKLVKLNMIKVMD